MILSYLRNSDIMALRGVCLKFYLLCPGPDPATGKWGAGDRAEYRRMLRGVEFRALCQKERDGETVEGTLVCSVCRSTHEERCFSERERKTEAEKRACLGTGGVLEVCSHVRVTYHGLRLKPVGLICAKPHRGDGDVFGVVEMEQPGSAEKEVVVVVELGLMTLERDEELESWRVDKAVRELDLNLCPHTHSISTDRWLLLWYKEMERPMHAAGKWYRLRDSTRTCPIPICEAENCDTRYSLIRDDGTGRLSLRVERHLGTLEYADDGKWIAQVVEPSRLKEPKNGQLRRCATGYIRV